MRRGGAVLVAVLLVSGCSDTGRLQEQIDDLTVATANRYRPGFGEFMSAVQVHHAKLWFAGTNANWPLAAFELGEIKETVESIERYETDRSETKALPILTPALDSVAMAVSMKDRIAFRHTFTSLTATCNTCHRSVKHGFIVITLPTSPPVSNQDFAAVPQE